MRRKAPIDRITGPLLVTLFLLTACGASEIGDPEVAGILDELAAAYPLEQLAAPLYEGAVGGINMWAYCLAQGYPAVGYRKGYVEGPGAARDNWVCQRGAEQLAPTGFAPVDMDAACAWQFGREVMKGRPSDENHAWSWSCYDL